MGRVRHHPRRILSAAILLAAGAIMAQADGEGALTADASLIVVPKAEAGPLEDCTFSLSADLVSKYVWRGMLQNGDAAVQPSATVTWKGLSLNVWQSWDTTNYGANHYPNAANRRGKVEETDYTLGYSRSILNDKLTLGGGAIYYTFPDTFPTTTELYVSAAVNTLLLPTLIVYKDIDESQGLYITPSISYTITINDKTNVVLCACMGWGDANNNDYYFSGMAKAKPAMADYGLTAQLNYNATTSFIVAPYVKFTDFIDHDIRDQRRRSSYDGRSEQVVVGLRAAWTF